MRKDEEAGMSKVNPDKLRHAAFHSVTQCSPQYASPPAGNETRDDTALIKHDYDTPWSDRNAMPWHTERYANVGIGA